jgi:hypothetical protein
VDGVRDALRCELIELLIQYRCKGRFTRAAQGTEEARSLFLVELTHCIADILITACPNKDSEASAAALADAKIIASSALDGRFAGHRMIH